MGPKATTEAKQASQPPRAAPPQQTPEALAPDRLLQLQHKVGNQGVLRLLEAGRLQRRRPGDTNGQARLQPSPSVAVLQRQAVPEEEEPPLTQRMKADDEEPMQGRFIAGPTPVQRQDDGGGNGVNATGMLGRLRAGLEGLSGLDLSGVRVHRNSSKPAQIDALAYTQGQDIHVAPGRE